jgi:hypothetical protein
MNTYAIINNEGKVVNMIVWNGVDAYSVPDGFTIELANESHLQKWKEQADALAIIMQAQSAE